MLAFIALVEGVMAPQIRRCFWPQLFLYSRPWHDALRMEAGIQRASGGPRPLYLFGSSQAREGVDTRRANDALPAGGHPGIQVINLGVSAGGPVDAYLQLDRVLAQKPAMIVFLSYRCNQSVRYLPEKLRDFSFSLKQLCRLIPLYGFRNFLEDLRGESIPGVAAALLLPSTKYFRYVSNAAVVYLADGFRQEPQWFAYEERLSEAVLAERLKEKQAMRPELDRYAAINKRVFHAMAAEIMGRGIPFAVVDAPLNPRILDLPNYEAVCADHLDFMAKEAAALHFPFWRQENYPPASDADFTDFTHLAESGREKFTDFLIQSVVLETPDGRGA
ncbi:MAG TPA: hypothetical protein VL688_11335 [Verrucomicrobiae bacterium]|jgi:hypothetical protein|nr:hypothetical protein [Verrucomicrobiae bacterium]